MAPKFGTSGLRGLVSELTDPLCAGYAAAFLADAETDGTVLIGQDLRSSSPRIAAAVAGAARHLGLRPLDCGVVPTPALALAAETNRTAAVMITGSHIPDDRNGLKFYTRSGEITKADETSISKRYAPLECAAGAAETYDGVLSQYRARYRGFFAGDALTGLRVGVFEHSSAARDVLGHVLGDLGAEVVRLGRSDHFIPVDTEAVDPEMRAQLLGWVTEHGLDTVVSTDGDGDRPMVADETGQIVPGDRLGPLTAELLGARVIATPVSANTCVDLMGRFEVLRTRIGSPYVISAMEGVQPAEVVGYEPNGGFLTGFAATSDQGDLLPLMTRDSVLPILAPLAMARARACKLSELVASLPPRFTAADRLQGVDSARAAAFLGTALSGGSDILEGFGSVADTDETDGVRFTFEDGAILHFRPSGNAPEFRVYTEADTSELAQEYLKTALARVAAALS